MNRNGGKETVTVEPDGRSLWGMNEMVIDTGVRPDCLNSEDMLKTGGKTQFGTIV